MIKSILTKQTHNLGGGLEVGRVLPSAARRMVGPYIFFDHMGPAYLPAGIPHQMDVRPHPHIGISTVTYLYEGAITHRDSLGSIQEIRPGEVNWMVTGSGITHSERFEYAREQGANMHGIQAWVALPAEYEETDPAFYHHEGEVELPVWEEKGVTGRLIAGGAEGMVSAAKVHSPQFYMHWQMAQGARRVLPAEYKERAIYVAAGSVDVAGHLLQAGQMAVLEAGKDVPIAAQTSATVMALGGEPIGERFMLWNFVSSSRERLEQARADWVAGRIKLPDIDNAEFTPFPASRGIE